MTRSTQIRTQIKITTLDQEEFNALTDLLYETLKGNQKQCAEVLGISRITWKRWEHTPPTWPYWNLVLRHVILEIIAQMRTRRGVTTAHGNRMLEAISRIKKGDTLIQEAERLSYEYRGAEAHLRRLLQKKGMYWDQIRLPANCGGYSEQALRVAARKTGIVTTQEGFGKSKRSYWRLPDEVD